MRHHPRADAVNPVAVFDHAAARRLATADSWLLDLTMPRLSALADHSLLWAGLAAGLWAWGDRRARRAASRGLGSLTMASLMANVASKGAPGRARPGAGVPPAHAPPRPPRTSSFPSGQAASAAAFATGALVEKPAADVPVSALALAVAASRVNTGVHFPSDVLTGLAIGTVSALATLRWWPRWPRVPAAAFRPPQQAPAAPTGRGMFPVINRSAGSVLDGVRRRVWLCFVGNCGYESAGMAPGYRPDLTTATSTSSSSSTRHWPSRAWSPRYTPAPWIAAGCTTRGQPCRCASPRLVARPSGSPWTERWPPPSRRPSRRASTCGDCSYIATPTGCRAAGPGPRCPGSGAVLTAELSLAGAGALGSTPDSEEPVRKAAYSLQERERQARNRELAA
jgi:membrane-associated phospholipid phosphatase